MQKSNILVPAVLQMEPTAKIQVGISFWWKVINLGGDPHASTIISDQRSVYRPVETKYTTEPHFELSPLNSKGEKDKMGIFGDLDIFSLGGQR